MRQLSIVFVQKGRPLPGGVASGLELMNRAGRILRFGPFLCATLVAPLFGAVLEPKASVIANIDMTEAGKKIARPTVDHPAYYAPIILGFSENGELVANEKPPKRAEVLRQIAKALAKEGYVLQALRPNADRTLPSLILTFSWGYLNPQVTDFGDDPDPTLPPSSDSSAATPHLVADFNAREMTTLVAGDALARGVQFTDEETKTLRDAAAEGRYFIIVSAYAFDPDPKSVKKLLWRARMSTERQGVDMDDVVAALVSGGASIFGRDLERPSISRNVLRGHVEVGTPTVVGASSSSDPKPDANDRAENKK